MVGNAPGDIFTPGDGGDGMAVEFGEVEVTLRDRADALNVHLRVGYEEGRLVCDIKWRENNGRTYVGYEVGGGLCVVEY